MATADLDIKINSGDVPNATKQLQQLASQGAATESATNKMAGVFVDAAERMRAANGRFLTSEEKASTRLKSTMVVLR